MNNAFKYAGLALSLLFAGSVFAQETAMTAEQGDDVSNDWHISLGLSYRDFKAPKFRSVRSAYSLAAVYDGELYPIEESGNGGLGYVPGLAGNKQAKTISVLSSTGGGATSKGSYSDLEQIAPIVGFEYALSQSESFTLNLAANFQYFHMDSASRGGKFSGSESAEVYPFYDGSIGPYALSNGKGEGMMGGAAKTTMDMDLYVLDLGVSVDYEFENSLVLSLAAGPSVTLADIDSSSRSGSSFGGSRSKHDDDIEFEYGYYISGGIAYWFSEKYGISFDLRYDKAFGEVGTKYVSQNLDAWSGQLQFLIRF